MFSAGLGWNYPCDLWSVGCILVELLFLGRMGKPVKIVAFNHSTEGSNPRVGLTAVASSQGQILVELCSVCNFLSCLNDLFN